MTLLDRAKALAPKYGAPPPTVTDEQIDLLLAFLNGEVTYGQVAKVFGVNRSAGAGARVVSLMRRAVALGKLRVEAVR